MVAIADQANVMLNHDLRTDFIVGGTETYFTSHHFTLERPERKEVVTVIVCPDCEYAIPVRVLSRARTERRRRWWLAVAVVSAVVPVVLLIRVLGFDIGDLDFASASVPVGLVLCGGAAVGSRSYQGAGIVRGFVIADHKLYEVAAPGTVRSGPASAPVSKPIPPPPRFQALKAFAGTLLTAVGFGFGAIAIGYLIAGIVLIVAAALAVPALMVWEHRRAQRRRP